MSTNWADFWREEGKAEYATKPPPKNLQCPICLTMVSYLEDRSTFPGVNIKSCGTCVTERKMNSYLVTQMLEQYGYRWQDVSAVFGNYLVVKDGKNYLMDDFLQRCLYRDEEEEE